MSSESSSEPPKRVRKVHQKTRTGCKTCKIRKVKCDEAKPFCKRCTSTGRKCDGYPSSQPIHFSPSSINKSSSSSQDSSSQLSILQQVQTTIPGTETEKRSFQFFVNKTAAELSGYFQDGFWKGFVLRASHERDNGALRHAIMGIGALHEEFEREEGEREEGGDRFAVGQYSKAITHLRNTLESPTPSQSPLTALISSILFVTFDSLKGSFASAMVHLQSGLNILKSTRADIKLGKTKVTKEEQWVIEKYIAPLFVRLGMQAILYLDTRTTAEKAVIAKGMLGAKGEDEDDDENEDKEEKKEKDKEKEYVQEKWVFDSLETARDKLNIAAESLFQIFYIADGEKPFASQTSLTHRLHLIATKSLTQWTLSFQSFMATKTNTLTSLQIRGATLLKIHHCVVQCMLSAIPKISDPRSMEEAMNAASTFSTREAIELFATATTLARSLINAIESSTSSSDNSKSTGAGAPSGKKVFSTDLGIVGPLYYISTKCAIPSIRQEAMNLLSRWKGREGMWDSAMSHRVVTEFWEMETKFGSRGYDVVDLDGRNQGGKWVKLEDWNQILKTTKDPVKDKGRAKVSLVLGEGRKWEWRVRLAKSENEDENGGETTIPSAPAPPTLPISMIHAPQLYDNGTISRSSPFPSSANSPYPQQQQQTSAPPPSNYTSSPLPTTNNLDFHPSPSPFNLDPFEQPFESETEKTRDWTSLLYQQQSQQQPNLRFSASPSPAPPDPPQTTEYQHPQTQQQVLHEKMLESLLGMSGGGSGGGGGGGSDSDYPSDWNTTSNAGEFTTSFDFDMNDFDFDMMTGLDGIDFGGLNLRAGGLDGQFGGLDMGSGFHGINRFNLSGDGFGIPHSTVGGGGGGVGLGDVDMLSILRNDIQAGGVTEPANASTPGSFSTWSGSGGAGAGGGFD